MTETRPTYAPDPFEELRGLLLEDEAAKLVQLLKKIEGWGEVRLPFNHGRLTRPTVTIGIESDYPCK